MKAADCGDFFWQLRRHAERLTDESPIPFYGQGVGFDGYILLAILTLFFVYFLPSLIRSAQVVADARIEDRFSGNLQIIATAGQKPPTEVSAARTYLHPPRKSEHPMNTPVARKLAAADARRVAAARAARAAAASRRVAAAKRRMLLFSVLGALTISGWILTATVSLAWVVPALLTAVTVGVIELGRRAAAAGAKADAELAERVRVAEARAGIYPGEGVAAKLKASRRAGTGESAVKNSADAETTSSDAPAEEMPTVDMIEPSSSLRVDVDPAKVDEAQSSWTPVPVPPPAYTLKAEVRRKLAEPYAAPVAAGSAAADSPAADAPGSAGTAAPQTAEVAPEVPAEAERAPGKIPSLTDSRSTDVASEAAPAAESAEEPEAATGSLNVQEILARRRAVG